MLSEHRRQKCREYQAAHRARRSPEKREQDRRKSQLWNWKKSGIDPDQADAALEYAKHWGCRICGSMEPRGSGTWHVDHCHKTGRVRGALCYPCNSGLGYFRDDPCLLQLAQEYLQGGS